MKLLSLNIGLPREVNWQGRTVPTAIIKEPIAGPVMATPAGLAGDGVADPSVHGGEHKAVYVYPFEHYDHFAKMLNRSDFVKGQFGENLTTHGLLESEVCIGDQFQIGEAVFEVTQPREPCFKLGMRMGSTAFPKQFLQSLRTGFYLRVVRSGQLIAGQPIERSVRRAYSLSVSEITRVCFFDKRDLATIRRAAAIEWLTPSWRAEFQERTISSPIATDREASIG